MRRRNRRRFVVENLEGRMMMDAGGYAARWMLDEGVGTAVHDSTGNVPVATATCPDWSLDTSNDMGFSHSMEGDCQINIPASSVLDMSSQSAYSLSLWIKADPFNGNESLYSQNGLSVSLNNGQLVASTAAGSLVGPQVTTGVWHNIVVDAKGGSQVFLDGKAVTTTPGTGVAPSTSNTVIGQNYHGLIDDVRIYDIALSKSQASDIYMSGQPMTMPNMTNNSDSFMQGEQNALMALVPRMKATEVAVNSGLWSDPHTWLNGMVPKAGDDVLIVDGRSVTYDVNSATALHTVRVDGSLTFDPTQNTHMVVDTFIVGMPGTLNVVNTNNNITTQIEFAQDGPINTTWDPYLYSRGLISLGTATITGATKTPYVALSQPALAGQSTLSLATVPTNWKVGDTLILGGTDYNPSGNNADHSKFEDEILQITGINGTQVSFANITNPSSGGQSTLLWNHEAPAGYGLQIYVANMTRNVMFDTQNYASVPISQRGHVMFMHTDKESLSYAEFYQLGRTDKSKYVTDPKVVNGQLVSGGENPRARYAVHFHRTGDSDPNAMPVQVVGCTVYGSPGWGFVNHESNVDMTDNVAFACVGSSFINEDGDELGSFNQNMSIETTGDANPRLSLDDRARVGIFDFGFNGEAFWLQGGGPGITMSDNIAISAAGGGVGMFAGEDGMTFDEQKFAVDKVPDAGVRSALEAAGFTYVSVDRLPSAPVTGMQVYNSRYGLFTWGNRRMTGEGRTLTTFGGPPLDTNNMSMVQDFKFWNIYDEGTFSQYSTGITFQDGLILGNLTKPIPFVAGLNGQEQGAGIDHNGASAKLYMINLDIEGFGHAIDVPPHNYPYLQSELVGGYFAHNKQVFGTAVGFSWAAMPLNFQISGNPTFVHGADKSPVPNFTTSAAGGLALNFNAQSSYDPDMNDPSGNGIVSYHWNFGDGQTADEATIPHYYASPGTYNVSLTVWDNQGVTSTITHSVTVGTTPYKEMMVNGNFADASKFTSTHYFNWNDRGRGWISTRWQQNSGYAQVVSPNGAVSNLIQVTRDRYVRRGNFTLNLNLRNIHNSSKSDNIRVMVYGVNGPFYWPNTQYSIPPSPLLGQTNVTKTLLNTQVGGKSFDWKNLSFNVDLGSTGYEYIVVRIYTSNLDTSRGDSLLIKNASFTKA